MSQDFLGAGFSFPIVLDPAGRAVLVREEDTIRRALWLVLSTTIGERVMRPDWGCALPDFVFAAPSAETLGRIAHAVERAVIQFEPRVALQGVDVRADPADPARVLIDLSVQLLARSTTINLVYPFYLGDPQDG